MINIEHLPFPSSNWNVDMIILGIPYGKDVFVKDHWKGIVNDIKVVLQDSNDVYNTFDAKSIITKSIVLPKISYIATVYDIPREIKNSVETMIFRYIVPKGNIYHTLCDLAKKGNMVVTTLTIQLFMLMFLV